MSGRSILWTAVLGIGAYIGASVLMFQATTPDPSKDAGNSSTAKKKTTDQIGDTAKTAAPKGAKKTANKAAPAKAAPKTFKGTEYTATLPNAKPDAVSGPRFVELKLNRGEKQLLSGRADKGTVVTALKNGKAIGTATANPAGNWMLPLEKPIADKAYRLSLKGVPKDGGAADTGQSADVLVDETGHATVKILPAPSVATALGIPGLPKTKGASKTAVTEKAPSGSAKTDDSAVADADGTLEQATRMAEAATEKFSDVVGKDGKADGASDAAKSVAADALEFSEATLEAVEGQRPTVKLAGKSIPGAELGLFVGDKRIAGTFSKPDGSWSLSKSITTGAAPLKLRIDQFDSKGNVVASAARIAKRAQGTQVASTETPGTGTTSEMVTNKKSGTKTQTAATDAGDGTKQPVAGSDTNAEDKARLAKRKAKRRAAARRVAAAKRRARNRARYRERQRAQRVVRLQARRRAQRRLRNRRTVSRNTRSRRIIRLNDNPPIDVRVTRLNNSFRTRARGFGASRYIRRWRP